MKEDSCGDEMKEDSCGDEMRKYYGGDESKSIFLSSRNIRMLLWRSVG